MFVQIAIQVPNSTPTPDVGKQFVNLDHVQKIAADAAGHAQLRIAPRGASGIAQVLDTWEDEDDIAARADAATTLFVAISSADYAKATNARAAALSSATS